MPGSHQGSNAIGFHKAMSPATDRSPLIQIYNWMLSPPQLKTITTFDYQADRVFFTRDIGGIRCVFLHIWPDSAMRARMELDLQAVSPSTPVVTFTHDQPDAEAKHVVNPNVVHDSSAGAAAHSKVAASRHASEGFMRMAPSYS